MTNEQIKFIEDNFRIKGITALSKEMKMNPVTIRPIIEMLGLKSPRSENVIYHEVFENMTDFAAYFLGYLWADGSITTSTLQIEISSVDANTISDIFFKVGNWRVRERQRYQNGEIFGNLMTTFSLTDRKFAAFLRSMDFIDKSTSSPSKLLNFIPDKFHNDFWHGFFDGDASVYVGSKSGKPIISVAFWGAFSQDWSDLTQFLDRNSISYTIRYYERLKPNGQTHRSSCVSLKKRPEMDKLGDIFYEDGLIGLDRKMNKFALIKQILAESNKNRSDVAIKKASILSLYEQGLSVLEISKILSLSTGGVYHHVPRREI